MWGALCTGSPGGRVQEATLFVVGIVQQGVFSEWNGRVLRVKVHPLVTVWGERRFLHDLLSRQQAKPSTGRGWGAMVRR